MMVRVEAGSPVPPFEQLRSQIAGLVAAGQLRPGTRLPPIRQLAADLGVAPGTVARAYRELEAAGLVVTQGRRGTRVTDRPTSTPTPPTLQRLQAAAATYAAGARELGLEESAALAAVRDAFARASVPGSGTARGNA